MLSVTSKGSRPAAVAFTDELVATLRVYLDLVRRLQEDIPCAGEALFRIAQTRGPLLSLWSDFQARKWARKVLSSRKSHFRLVRETVAGQTRISLVMTGRNSGGRPPVADLIKSPRFDPVGATRRGVHSTE